MNEHILDAIPTLEEEISPAELMVQSISRPVLWGLIILLVLLVALVVWLVLRSRKRRATLPRLLRGNWPSVLWIDWQSSYPRCVRAVCAFP